MYLERETLQTDVVQKIRTYTLWSMKLYPKNRAFYEIMYEIYGSAGQTADDNTTWRMRVACLVTKDKNTK